MIPLDYYSLGYCIAHSQCQWVFTSVSGRWINEKHVNMFLRGVSTRHKTTGRVVGLRSAWCKESTYQSLNISAEALIMLFTECSSVLHLQELLLQVPQQCNITWPDLSALKVLLLEVTGLSHWKLDTHFALESLFFEPDGECPYSEFDNCVAISDHIKSTKILKQLSFGSIYLHYIGSMCIGEKGLEVIATALANNHSIPLERLQFVDGCTFTDTAAHCLAQFIANTTTLQRFRIAYCTFTAHGLLELATAIHYHPTLHVHTQDLKCTVTGDQEMKDFTQLLNMGWEHRANLKRITGITYAGIEALAEVLCHNFTLDRLYLSENNIGNSGAVALAHTLHHNSTLWTLDLSKSSVSDAGAVALAQALHHNSTLKFLKLSNNSVGDAGAVALAQALHHNATLAELYLSNNSVGDAGAVALAQALHHNSTLSELYLSNNSVGDAGAVALAQALHHNSTLSELYLSNNSVGDAGEVALDQVPRCPSRQLHIHLHDKDCEHCYVDQLLACP